MKFLAKGKRGQVYLEKKGKKLICIKKSNEDRIRNEVYWLKILNKHKIGPNLINYNKKQFSCDFIDGKVILEHLKENKKDTKKIVVNILKQCRIMDKLKVNKLEMHKPLKHIIISKNKPVMIDFERCKQTPFPKNVTQFCQFLTSVHFKGILRLNRNKMIKVLKEYKKEQNDINFWKIVKSIEKF